MTKVLQDPRRIAIDGIRNFRVVASARSAGRRRLREGLLYRAGHAAGLSPAARQAWTALGIATIVDLRTTEERRHHPYDEELIGARRYWRRDYAYSRGATLDLLHDPAATAAAMTARMHASYREIAYEQREGIAAAVEALAEGRGPLLVNCSAGKDRTGVVIAILLWALGVDRDAIIEDYCLTERLYDPAAPLFEKGNPAYAFLETVDPAVWATMMRAAPDYLESMFDEIERRHGSVETFLAREAGISASRLEDMREACFVADDQGE